jgi:hypothetical protein
LIEELALTKLDLLLANKESIESEVVFFGSGS